MGQGPIEKGNNNMLQDGTGKEFPGISANQSAAKASGTSMPWIPSKEIEVAEAPVAKNVAPKSKGPGGPFLVAACDAIVRAAAVCVAKEQGYPSLTAYHIGAIKKAVERHGFSELVQEEIDNAKASSPSLGGIAVEEVANA